MHSHNNPCKLVLCRIGSSTKGSFYPGSDQGTRNRARFSRSDKTAPRTGFAPAGAFFPPWLKTRGIQNGGLMNEPTVLVVDDSPTVRKIVQMTLQREHIRVITAGDGLSALASVADEIPAVILLDIQLPRMDGYYICQIIRKNLQFRQIPIIMLSGKDGLFDKMRGIACDAVARLFNNAIPAVNGRYTYISKVALFSHHTDVADGKGIMICRVRKYSL